MKPNGDYTENEISLVERICPNSVKRIEMGIENRDGIGDHEKQRM